MTTPGGLGSTALVYQAVGVLCGIFKNNPNLHAHSITILENGKVEIAAVGTAGVLRDWSRAVPDHRHTTSLVAASYGADEADVIEAAGITVTIRRPLAGPGGVMS